MTTKVDRRRPWTVKVKESVRDSLLLIFFSNLRPVKAITVWLYLLAALSFQTDMHEDDVGFQFLLRVLDANTWTVLYLIPAASRVSGLLLWQGNIFTRLLIAGTGIWLWSMMFIGQAIMAPAHLSYMLLICLVIEVWIIAQYLTERLDDVIGRKRDAT